MTKPKASIDGGKVIGFVDLGELGVADRWGDVAVATWSVTWNPGTGWEQPFLKPCCVVAGPGRMAFYSLLYDLIS